MKQPWFKFWAADYLTDADVAKVPPEGRELLIRMWCVCNLRGSVPCEIEDISIATGLRISYVSEWLTYLLNKNPCQLLSKPFFELRDGAYISPRMEAEKAKSERARENAYRKANKDNCAKTLANGSAKPPAQKTRKPETQNNNLVPLPDVPPPGLSSHDYAEWFWRQLGMPESNIETTSSAIENYARLERLDMNRAVLVILGKAREDVNAGKKITRWWLENGEYLRKAPAKPAPELSPSQKMKILEDEALRKIEKERQSEAMAAAAGGTLQ